MNCRVITPPATDECGKPATHVVTFCDGDHASACERCSLLLQELAKSFGGSVYVRKIGEDK